MFARSDIHLRHVLLTGKGLDLLRAAFLLPATCCCASLCFLFFLTSHSDHIRLSLASIKANSTHQPMLVKLPQVECCRY